MLNLRKDFLSQLDVIRLWNGSTLPPALHLRLVREYERLQLVKEQRHQLELSRQETIRTSTNPAVEQVRRLLQLNGIGIHSAWLFVMEFFAWRGFHNRRELGLWLG